mgnify:CR=1 FL=1|jgi:hypothetical protein|tara:strand:+ start:223 stop:2721 length:2499 start_codon:yes stop_codon:yes gene_type:complete
MATEKDTFDSTFGSTPFNPFTPGEGSGGSGGSGLASNNPFGQSQVEYRRKTPGDRWKQFFGFDIGATNQEGIDRGRSNQLGNILDIQTQILGDARTFKNTEWEDLPDQSAFRDEEAFDKFKNELEVDDTDLFKLTPSTAVTLGKALGDESNGRYNASLLQNSLGYDYKLFGKGKKIDWIGSQYGINQNGRYAIINPLVRSVGRNKDGGQFFYSADLTSDGTNLADMTDSEIASDQEFLGGVTKDFAGQDIPINKYLDTAYKALYTDLVNKMPNGGQIGAMVGLTEQAFDQYKAEFDKISSETTDRRTKLDALNKIITATEQEDQEQAFTGGDGLTLTETDNLFGLKERVATADTKEEVLEAIKQFKASGDKARGYVVPQAGLTGEYSLPAYSPPGNVTTRDLKIYPKGSIYGISDTQLGFFSIEEQQKLRRESDNYREGLLKDVVRGVTNDIDTRIREERRAGPEDGISTEDRRNNIKTVNEFYSGKEHKELIDRLSAANPEKLQEYLNDPYEFALNNSKTDLFGAAVSSTDDSAIRASLSKESLTYFPKIKKAIENGESIDSIRTLINQAIEVNDKDQAKLEELFNIPAMANGNLGQASPVARYGAMLRIYGTMDPNSKMYNTFMTSDNVTNFLTYGTFIAPEQVSAPPVDTSGISVLSNTLDSALGNLDFTKIDDPKFSTTERNNMLNEGVANLGTANAMILSMLRGVENGTTDARIIQNEGFKLSVQRYKEGQAKLIQMKIKQLADKSWWRDLIEKIPFVSNYDETPQAFMETMSRLRDDPDAQRFIILDPAGGSSVASISYEDVQDPNLMKAFKEQAAVSAILNKNNL